MPGFYRRMLLVPNVLFESGCYPWKIDPSMKHITYRYELEWKDRVYIDVTYHIIDESKTLVEIECVNNTDIYQNLVLNNVANINFDEFYPKVKAINTDSLKRIRAIDYFEYEPAKKTPQYNLVYDGLVRGEERSSNSLDGSLLAAGFGKSVGDKVIYKFNVESNRTKGTIVFRYKIKKGEKNLLTSKGLLNGNVELIGAGDFTTLSVPYSTKIGENKLELTTQGGCEIAFDGFFLGTQVAASKLSIINSPLQFTPVIDRNKEDFILKYPDCKEYYGVAWNYKLSEIREFANSELDIFLRKYTHDHVKTLFVGDSCGNFTTAFLRPIVLNPNSRQTLYNLLAFGNKETVKQAIELFHKDQYNYIGKIEKTPAIKNEILPEGKQYQFGNQILQANLLSNVVYPVYTQKEYIRHFTPGKNWNSLYTWDSGFIALGLMEVDPTKAFECIRAYTTPVGAQSAFIHHGTPLPIQIFAYSDLRNELQSKETLAFLYPRLKQYYDFMTGKTTSSTRMSSGLLRTWNYFYNSGGWDDYPPQQSLISTFSSGSITTPVVYSNTTPVVSTSYYIRAAKILHMAAKELGFKSDMSSYETDIKEFSKAIQNYTWDNESGYFSYVLHNEKGEPLSFYRYKDGSNYNKGFDGVTPLIAGVCTKQQTEKLLSHIFSPKEMWTDVGVSTVDQSASYYKTDGYWNGTVWMPHQWLLWKSFLDLGKGNEAQKIAITALSTWEKECRESYNSPEHFIIASGRGAGWSQFSGLSSPVLNWFSSYFKIGKVSTGFEIWISNSKFNQEFSSFQANLTFDETTIEHNRCILVCLNPNYTYSATFNGNKLTIRSPYPGFEEITLPATNKFGILNVFSEN